MIVLLGAVLLLVFVGLIAAITIGGAYAVLYLLLWASTKIAPIPMTRDLLGHTQRLHHAIALALIDPAAGRAFNAQTRRMNQQDKAARAELRAQRRRRAHP